MTTLVWNLEENATRRHLLAEALLQLPEERRAQVLAAAEAAGVPDGHHHDLGEVNATIDALDASERAKDDMRAVYRILAEAEATAHGCAVEETHFHEVGNGEALRNVLAICLAVEALDPDEIAATRVQTGSGPRRAAHPRAGHRRHHRPRHPHVRAQAGRRALHPHERRRHPPLRAALRRVATRSAAPRRSASSECFT